MQLQNCGYRISIDDAGIHFVPRRPSIGIAFVLSALIGLALAALAATPLVSTPGRVALGLGAMGLLAYTAWRGLRHRRSTAKGEYRFSFDRQRQALLDAKGQPVAAAGDIEWCVRFDPFDSMQGFMYAIELHWPEGRARVYKLGAWFGARAKAEAVRDQLVAAARPR